MFGPEMVLSLTHLEVGTSFQRVRIYHVPPRCIWQCVWRNTINRGRRKRGP
jgi:hypothetical protein